MKAPYVVLVDAGGLSRRLGPDEFARMAEQVHDLPPQHGKLVEEEDGRLLVVWEPVVLREVQE